MRIVFRLLTLLAVLVGGAYWRQVTGENRALSKQVEQLEAEVGRMLIDDPSRVYMTEIAQPQVPPEVASQIVRIWQFRCYLPPGYDFVRFTGGGEVTKQGCYLNGGTSSSWGTPSPDATHQLLTVSLQRKDKQIEVFYSFGGSSGTTSWGSFSPEELGPNLVVQKLAESKQGARSFKADAILPLLKLYDSASATDKQVAGNTLTIFQGGCFVLYPKSREAEFRELTRGVTPVGFDPATIAEAVSDE